MPDTQTLEQPTQQVDGAANTSPTDTPGSGKSEQSSQIDWESRYHGATRALAQRDLQMKELRTSLEQTSNLMEQLRQEMTTKTAEGDAKVASLADQLKALSEERDQAQAERDQLTNYKVKMDALKEFPSLLPLADTIPSMSDPETMAEHLKMLAKGVDDIASDKAKKLTQGITPGPTAPQTQPTYAYSTRDEWQRAMNQAAGTPKFNDVSDAYLKWASKQ